MTMIGGYVTLNVRRTTQEAEEVTVDGSEFGLEQGGEWRRDPDDGELCAGFIFIAFNDGFDLILNLGIHGNAVTDYTLRVRENDLEAHDIQSVTILDDALDIDGVFPGDDDPDY